MDVFLKYTAHARIMMHERNIQEDWIIRTFHEPVMTEKRQHDEIHYLKPIPEADGKVLRVIINPISDPPQIITVFFDRRIQL